MSKIKYWTDNEITLLKEIYQKKPRKELVKIFNRTEFAIIAKAAELDLTQDRSWSTEHLDLLKEKYSNTTISILELSKLVGKTKNAVASKIAVLKIKKYVQEVDLDFLRQNYSNKEISPEVFEEHLNMNWINIVALAGRLGLKRKTFYKVNSDYFNSIDTWEKSYIIGLLWADGHNDISKHRITLSLQEQDKHILESINNILHEDRPLMLRPGRMAPGYKQKNKDQYVLRTSDKNISKVLEDYGMVYNKTKVLKFPTCIPDQFLSAFILGYFDGDGTISVKDRKYNTFSICGTLDMVTHIKDILVSECMVDNINIRQSDNIFLITWANKSQLKRIREYLYKDATLFLTRKKDKFYSIKDYEHKYYKNKHLHDLLQ